MERPGEPQWLMPDGAPSDRCPFGMVTPASDYVLELHRHYARGLLPCPGGVTDQPAWLLDAFRIIDTAPTFKTEPTTAPLPASLVRRN